MDFDKFKEEIEEESFKNINKLHQMAKKVWQRYDLNPYDLQHKCVSRWDELEEEIGCKVVPLIKVYEDRPVTNLIFGSGSFSTGEFQASQYKKVRSYLRNNPITLQGIVTNKSKKNGCNGKTVALKYDVPYISLDFTEWYHRFIDKNEPNPTAATRYWYLPNDPNKPSSEETNHRFDIRQNHFHKALGEEIEKNVNYPTDIVSARGYNFQFCSNLFLHQNNELPAINDTHPTDLTYIDTSTKERLYPGWQSQAVQLMLDDKITHIRGSLIGIDYMNKTEQIYELDEGPLLAIGQGIELKSKMDYTSHQIQELIKIVDDYFFCTLEPTGIILVWGISEEKLPVTYQDVSGVPITIEQHAIIVGEKVLSGINVFGNNLAKNLEDLEKFLLS
ncbi:MAG: hypothetical protein EU531_09755 [Promethearchaeota archaeon]|nr:MAG: hypothetical protein EU531_09755 [Candidatus Lokiarchaeota archaeon]